MARTLKDTLRLFRELKELKKNKEKIIPIFYDFRISETPREAIKKIINTARENPALDDLLKISKTQDLILKAEKEAEEKDWNYACEEFVRETGVNYEIRGTENVPERGGDLYVCNHPYGLLDAAALVGGLGSLLNKKGRELKIIATNQLRFIKGIEKKVYFVNSKIKKINSDSIKGALKYLDEGGDLAIYPAGKISKEGLKDYPWKNGSGIFIPHSYYVVPMWFSGPNHAKVYNFLAKFKKTEKLRGIFSLREAWNKAGETIVLNIGKPIRAEKLKEMRNNGERVQYLRQTAENLKI